MTIKVSLLVKIFITSIILLVVAQVFNGSLTITAFEQLHSKSLISSYQLVAKDIQRNIEVAVKFGKSLDQFYGINKLIDDLKSSHEEIENISIIAANGEILYSLKTESVGHQTEVPVTAAIRKELADRSIQSDLNIVNIENSYHLLLPILERNKTIEGYVDLTISGSLVDEKVNTLIAQNLLVLFLSVAVASTLLFFALKYIYRNEARVKHSQRVLFITLLLLIGGSQFFFSTINIKFFRSAYLDVTQHKVEILSKLLKEDIEFWLQKGIKINKLIKIDSMMSDIISVIPEIEQITIVDKENNNLYKTTSQEITAGQSSGNNSINFINLGNDASFQVRFPLLKDQTTEGYIRIFLSKSYISTKISEIILDSVTVVVISFLFIIELLIFLVILFQRELTASRKNNRLATATPYGIIRPVAFTLLFAVALSISFLPIHMANLYGDSIPWISREVILGLPISIEMLFTLLILFPGGHWMETRGWHEPFLAGIAITALGMVLSGIANLPFEFVLYRGIVGVGYGLAWISIQGYLVEQAKDRNRAKDISNLVAGIFSGSICGSAVGAMLGERCSFETIFIVAACLMVIPLLIVLVFMRHSFTRPESTTPCEINSKPLAEYLAYFSNRYIFSIFVFSIVPTSICTIGVLYYFNPLYLKEIGVSQSNIGRAFMIYGLCMIYIAPFISRFVDKSENKRMFIIIGGLCGSVGLGLFCSFGGFYMVLLMIFSLGLASSFGSASQFVYVINNPLTQKIGYKKALSFQRTADKVGQMLGPIIFGIITGIIGAEKGIAVLGLIYLVSTFFFYLFTLNSKKKQY